MSEPGNHEPAELLLSAAEARVLACLIEKEATTPEYYPLSLNALRSACNQKSNRDPVMQLDEDVILEALDNLRYRDRLAWQVSSSGSRVMKYRHNILDSFNFSARDTAILCELMLRGPQTVGELRSHTRRLCEFESLPQVEEHLNGLMDCGGRRLVARLPREPGRREQRYKHLLCGDQDLPPAAGDESPPATGVCVPDPPEKGRVDALAEQVAELRRELDALKSELATFRSQFE